MICACRNMGRDKRDREFGCDKLSNTWDLQSESPLIVSGASLSLSATPDKLLTSVRR